MMAILNLGVLPVELTRQGVRKGGATPPPVKRSPAPATPIAATIKGSQSPELKQLLRDYFASDTAQISKSDRPTVVGLINEVDGRLAGVMTGWVDAWVRHMKRDSSKTGAVHSADEHRRQGGPDAPVARLVGLGQRGARDGAAQAHRVQLGWLSA